MVRRDRDVLPRLLSERFDGARALREELEQLESAGTGGCLTDTGNLLVNGSFQGVCGFGRTGHNQMFKCLFEYVAALSQCRQIPLATLLVRSAKLRLTPDRYIVVREYTSIDQTNVRERCIREKPS